MARQRKRCQVKGCEAKTKGRLVEHVSLKQYELCACHLRAVLNYFESVHVSETW